MAPLMRFGRTANDRAAVHRRSRLVWGAHRGRAPAASMAGADSSE